MVGGFFNWTFELVYGDTSPQFAVADCPIVSSGNEEENGECPDLKTIEKEGQTIVAEESDTNASIDSNVVEQSNTSASNDRNVAEQSDTSMPLSSGPVNPFGP